MASATRYALGSSEAEIARLDLQAQAIAPATDVLLRTCGIEPGMRVLDLGTGLGHVALAVADSVGPSGEVVGIDQAEPMLRIAEQRAREAGIGHVRFLQADARTFRDERPFDAVVSRLLLFHLPDRLDVVRHHLAALRPGGLMLGLEYDIGATRAEPDVPLVRSIVRWMETAFRGAGADPRIGARLAVLLAEAGVADVRTFGVQTYFPPGDPRGPAMLAGVTRSLHEAIVGGGVATAAEVGLDTLQARVAAQVEDAHAVVLPPNVVGAWGRRPADGGQGSAGDGRSGRFRRTEAN